MSGTSMISRSTWKGEAYNDRMGHKSQRHAGFHNSDSDYDEYEYEDADSESEDAAETNEETEFDHARGDRSSISSEHSYDQYSHGGPTSRCSSVVGLLLIGENLNHLNLLKGMVVDDESFEVRYGT
jgi:hypothetical protein